MVPKTLGKEMAFRHRPEQRDPQSVLCEACWPLAGQCKQDFADRHSAAKKTTLLQVRDLPRKKVSIDILTINY